MRVLAPAKLNLHLRVGPPREDGFHPLLTWMVTVGLFDELEVEPAPGGGVWLECDSPEVPRDQRNLVSKAAAAFARARAGPREAPAADMPGVSVRLHKRIPVGAGLAGGSSDGACILAALNVLWRAGWSCEELADFAANFGSDLSFFFYAPSAICRGRGEVVRPIGPPRPGFAVLILPALTMPTPAVYRRFDEMTVAEEATIECEPDFNFWRELDSLSLLPLLVNDLERPAFAMEPKLGDLRREAERDLGRPVRMSGSGSSLFSLYDTATEAEAAARLVAQHLSTRAIAVALAPPLKDDVNTAETGR